jgi:hypothetical protein
VALEKDPSLAMMRVPTIPKRDPEGGVDEDHG